MVPVLKSIWIVHECTCDHSKYFAFFDVNKCLTFSQWDNAVVSNLRRTYSSLRWYSIDTDSLGYDTHVNRCSPLERSDKVLFKSSPKEVHQPWARSVARMSIPRNPVLVEIFLSAVSHGELSKYIFAIKYRLMSAMIVGIFMRHFSLALSAFWLVAPYRSDSFENRITGIFTLLVKEKTFHRSKVLPTKAYRGILVTHVRRHQIPALS